MGTEDTSCWTFGREILSHSDVKQYELHDATRSGLQGDQLAPGLFHYKAMLLYCNRCSLQFSNELPKNARTWERHCLHGSICCYKTHTYFTGLMVSFQMCNKYNIIMPVLMPCHLMVWKSQEFITDFWPNSLHTEISQDLWRNPQIFF